MVSCLSVLLLPSGIWPGRLAINGGSYIKRSGNVAAAAASAIAAAAAAAGAGFGLLADDDV